MNRSRSHSRSRTSSSSSSSSSSDSAEQRNQLQQPSTSAFYEGAVIPPTLANNLLHPPTTERPTNSRSNSWKDILTCSSGADDYKPVVQDQDQDRWDNQQATERTRLLRDDNTTTDHQLVWYKRPSPIWLLPGTFIMAISMGLTYAPKLEIYTQLICRSMDPEKSGVNLPPPISTTTTTTTRSFDNLSHHFTTKSSYYDLEFVRFHSSDQLEKSLDEQEEEEEKASKKRDREWANQCHRSSAVQSSVARLALILTLMMGILSSLTTGFWGSYSDRKGRKPVLILAMFGTVAMDAVFLITVNYHHLVSYNFLLVGPILDGLLGGFSTAQATTNAYLSDCTSPGSRAKIFSLLAGLMFAGFALGPILSSLLITYSKEWFGVRDPTQIVLIPFYLALTSHLIYLGLLSLGLPESLSQSRKFLAEKRFREETRLRKSQDVKADERARLGGFVKVFRRKFIRNLERLFGFLRPLGLLLPKKHKLRDDDDEGEGEGEGEEEEELRTNIDWGKDLKEYWNPQDVWNATEQGGSNDGKYSTQSTTRRKGKSSRDWSLTKIAIGYSTYMMIIAIISVKLQYANYTFDWSAKEDGLFLSYIGVLRVVALVGFLPLFIRILRRPAPNPIRVKPQESDEVEYKKWEKEKKWLKVVTDSHFDLRLAKLSLFIDLLGFLSFSIISLSPHPTPIPFLLSTFLQSLGSGASPTLQSLALAHSTPRDSGRLFASFSVVQSISSQVVGPILFGTTFINTIGKGGGENGKFNGMVFWLALGLCTISFVCVSSLRLRKVWIEEATPSSTATKSNTTTREGETTNGNGSSSDGVAAS